MLDKGLVQVYTGNGKGKTAAAFGPALRAAGRGNKVPIYHLLKPPSLALIEPADFVTEMKKIKHPFDKGTEARRGIEYQSNSNFEFFVTGGVGCRDSGQ